MNDLKFTTAGDYMKDSKCDICGKDYDVTCDWRQGRCPNHPPLIDFHSMRFYNLINTIKGWFKR